MRKGINIWTFRDQSDLPRCMALARAAGFEGIELAFALEEGPINPSSTAEDMRAIVRAAQAAGIEITSLASPVSWKYNMISDDREVRARCRELTARSLELAQALEADTVLIVPGFTGPFMAGPPAVRDYDVAYNRALEELSALAPVAARCGVVIGVENVWNRFLTSPIEMRGLIDQVAQPSVQAFFDVGNVLRTGYPEHWIRALGQRIKRVHFKDYKINVGTLEGFVDLLTGDVNYPEVMAALREVGYDGWCIAEIGPRRWQPESTLEATSRAMDIIFSA